MEDIISEVTAYLKARLAETEGRPDLHRNTIAEYQRLLKTAQERPGDYAAEAGDMFAVAKAEQLDRYENLDRLYRKMGNQGGIEGNDMILQAVKSSTGYSDLNYNIGKAQKEGAADYNSDAARRDALMNCIGRLFDSRVRVGEKKSASAAAAKKHWKELQDLDPGLTWERIVAEPFYRRCLYYPDDRLALIGSWLKEVVA